MTTKQQQQRRGATSRDDKVQVLVLLIEAAANSWVIRLYWIKFVETGPEQSMVGDSFLKPEVNRHLLKAVTAIVAEIICGFVS